MKYCYRLYMAPMSVDYTFRGYDDAMTHSLKRADYVSVWFDEIEANTIDEALEKIFAKHNRDDRPNGRGMRSLSISDVVVINHIPYYCDIFGWSVIPSNVW